MLRCRTVAATPVRSVSAAWQVITDLVADTIEVSNVLSRSDAEQAMAAAAGAGRMLIGGGHLDRHPLTLIAGLVHCEITTVSGTAALTAEENLHPVPGAAGAATFTIYLPATGPLAGVVADAVAAHPRLSDAAPPAPERRAAAGTGPLIDVDAVRKAVTGR
jgi:nucleoid-associated protein YgaU